jgi:hypothetical protein
MDDEGEYKHKNISQSADVDWTTTTNTKINTTQSVSHQNTEQTIVTNTRAKSATIELLTSFLIGVREYAFTEKVLRKTSA